MGTIAKPDDKAFRANLENHKSVIFECNNQVRVLTQKINERSSGRGEFDRKKSEFMAKIDEQQKQIDKLELDRKNILQTIDEKSREGKEMRSQVQSLKKSVGYKTEEEIDSRVKEIEYMIATSTITLKEEKKMLQQIQQLKQSKPVIGRFATMDATASSFEDNSIVPLRVKLGQVMDELKKSRNIKRELNDKMWKLNQERMTALEPLRSLFDERSELQAKINSEQKIIQQLRDVFDKEMKAYDAQQNALRALRYEKIKEEKEMKAMQRERDDLLRQLDDEDDPPITPEMLLLQQTLTYVNNTIKQNQNSKKDVSCEVDSATLEINAQKARDKDEQVLLPKSQRPDEFLLAPKKVHKKNQKNDGGNKSNKSMVVDMMTIGYFKELGIDPPLTHDELPNISQLLSDRLQKIKDENDEKYQNREKRKEEIFKKLEAVEKKILSAGGKLEKDTKPTSAKGDPMKD